VVLLSPASFFPQTGKYVYLVRGRLAEPAWTTGKHAEKKGAEMKPAQDGGFVVGRRPGTWRISLLLAALGAAFFLLGPGTAQSQQGQETAAAGAALEKELALSRAFREQSLSRLGPADLAALKKGKIVAVLEDIPGSPVKIGKGIGVLDVPAAVVMQVVTDLNNYKDFMPFTKESEVDLKRSGGDVIYFSSKLSVPLVSERFYTLKMTQEENVEGDRGSFYLSWSLDPEKKSNLFLNSGSWKLVPYGPDGGRTLALYTVITDPGGNIPNFIKDKSTRIGIPSVFEAITGRARQGLASGLYRLPLPEDKLDQLLRERVEASRSLDAAAFAALPAADRKRVLDGDILISMDDVPGSWVKMARAMMLVDLPSNRLWEVITAYGQYQEYIPYVAESRPDQGRGRRNPTYLTYRLHFVVFPFIKDRYLTVKLTEERDPEGARGEGFLQWELDPTRPANVNKNRGSWKLVPYGDQGEKTLVFYTILADPGGLSPWFWKNLSAKAAVNKVLKAIVDRAGKPGA